MPVSNSPKLDVPRLEERQASAELTVNDAINDFDHLVHCLAIDRDLTTPPGSPAQGDTYIVPSGATGAWASNIGDIAAYYGTAWVFTTPTNGMIVYVDDEDVLLMYDGTDWVDIAPINHGYARWANPAVNDEFGHFRAPRGCTLLRWGGVISGGTSVVVTLKQSTDRSASFTTLDSDTVTSTTTGNEFTTLTTDSIPDGAFVVYEIGTVTGTVDWIEVWTEWIRRP